MYYYNGNVGIATTTPASKLTVVGTIESTTGGIKFPDGTTQTTANNPFFSVHKNGTLQTVANDVWTKLTWSTEEYDTNNNFTDGRFTPTIAGKYLFNANLYIWPTTIGYQMIAMVYKNGSPTKYITSRSSTGDSTIYVNIILDANGTTDYFELWIYLAVGSGTDIQGNPTYTYFQGHKLP